MKKYFTAIFKSFYSPEIYRDAIVKWDGFGGKYLSFLSAVLAVMLSISFIWSIQTFKKEELPFLIKQVPAIQVTKGIVTVTGEQPVMISTSDKKINIIIDTTKTESELRKTDAFMGIGKNFLFLSNKMGTGRSFDLTRLSSDFSVDQKSIYRFWDRNIPLLQGLSVFLFWVGQFIDIIVECVVIAVLSYAVTAFMPEEYDFLTRMRLSVLAVTPAEVLTTFLNVTFNHLAQPWLVFLIACLYIYTMIVLIRKLPPITPSEEIIA